MLNTAVLREFVVQFRNKEPKNEGMTADDQTLIEKSKILYCVRQVCTGVEIRTKRTAKCPPVLKCMLSGGEEGFPDEAFSDEDIV